MGIKELIQSIKEGKEDIKEIYTKVAVDNLVKKLEEKKKEIAKTLFTSKKEST